MPVTIKTLGGTVRDQFAVPVRSVYTRKNKIGSIPPRARDMQSWHWNGSSKPDLVVRSPMDPEKWIKLSERDVIAEIAIQDGWAFKNRKGYNMVRPNNGACGWLQTLVGISRREHRFNGQSWEQVFEALDSGL